MGHAFFFTGEGLSSVQPHVKKQRTAANRLLIVRAWRVGLAYLEGKTKYKQPGKLTRDLMERLLADDNSTMSCSKTQFDRAREGWPELMPVWPFTLDMRPPWETDASLTPPEVLTQPLEQAPLLKLQTLDLPPRRLTLPQDSPPHRFGYTLTENYVIGDPCDYMCKILGYRRDEMVGCKAPELLNPDQNRATGGAGRPSFKLAREHPGERYTYGPIKLRAQDGYLVEVLDVTLFWSPRANVYVIDEIISEEADARYRMMHPGAQFPDPLDRQHFADHHALWREAENPVVSEPVRLEVTHANGEKEVINAVLQLPMFRRAASMLAAGLAMGSILDGMDGKLDGVIHWCYLLERMARLLG